MIPDDRLATTPHTGSFLTTDALQTYFTLDYEDGGIALNNANSGLTYQVWTLSTNGTDIFIESATHSISSLYTGAAITEISLAFDQNMQPTIAFVEGDTAKLRWYDSSIAAYRVTSFSSTVKNPRVCLDDKRQELGASSDVILGYIRNSNLYFRMQRDRYEVEYLLQVGVTGTLMKIGMNTVNSLMFEVLG